MPNINDFKGSFKDMARPTRFKVYGFGADRQLEFLCKAAQLPGSSLGVVPVPFHGRKIQIAGDRIYNEWTITVMNDDTMNIKKYFEDWSHKINAPEENVGVNVVEDYKEDGWVEQLAIDDAVIAKYKLVGCWPSEVAPVELSWESNDAVSEFTVTLQMDYWLREE